ncbi:MAG TPA: hypothetical protein VFF81_12235 [Noviherbaspirillum sp.]|nr:hypothetical protein [Noviherbaspirillum sp.]
MLALLLTHDADATHPALANSPRIAPAGKKILEQLLEHEALSEALRSALRTARAGAFGEDGQT